MNWNICSGCNQEMKGFVYGYDVECGSTEYDNNRFPTPLKCPECGINDWKHNHFIRWRVTYCTNENCKDQQYFWYRDWKIQTDYSRIPLPQHGWHGPINHRAMEIVFGTDNDKKLVKLGRTLELKEIDKRMKKVDKLTEKYTHSGNYSEMCALVE